MLVTTHFIKSTKVLKPVLKEWCVFVATHTHTRGRKKSFYMQKQSIQRNINITVLEYHTESTTERFQEFMTGIKAENLTLQNRNT